MRGFVSTLPPGLADEVESVRAAEFVTLTAGQRYQITPLAGAPVMSDCSLASVETHRLVRGTIVVCVESRLAETGERRIRISSPGGWVAACDLAPAPPPASLALDYDMFQERHLQIGPGDTYGIAFPFTIAGLREAGPEFLTAAFRAAGAIGAANRVTEIVALDKLDIKGASENGLLSVAYAQDEPGLQTDLFVKFPPADVHHKYGLLRLGNGEVEIARLSTERELPVRTAQSYFADYCSATSNYILITERIAFGVDPIEPAYRKGYDQHVPEIDEHYLVLTKALARLVSAHKTGSLGLDIEDIFPFARAARDFNAIVAPEARLDRIIDFIGRVAPQLFLPETTTPDFLAQWREDVLFGLRHKDRVLAYLLHDVDYTGLCHSNLNIDNAWYWRDEAGALQVGLLDWGGAGQMSLAQALSSMLMMPDPDHYKTVVRQVIDIFIADYADGCGILLDPEELRFQYKASLYSTAIYMFVTILADTLDYFPGDFFAGMKDRFDSRLQASGFSSAVIWIDNILREWLDDVTPGEACRRIVAQAQNRDDGAALEADRR